MNRIEHRPPPNLMFAGVQYLLMEGAGPELSAYYRSLVEEPLPALEVGPVFREFVLEHEERIVEMGNTRDTQTNECRRCVALLPMVMTAEFDRFHLIDVGASAGLNLGLDCYCYRCDDLEWGPESSLVLSAGSRGIPPRLHDIEVLSRTGLDLNPLDPADEEARRWLDALIWPEQDDRRSRLRQALRIVSDLPVFDESDDWARLIVDDGTGPRQVGRAHPHGEWIELF